MSGYQPSRSEEFMNDNQRCYFRDKLVQWRESLIDDNSKQQVDQNVAADVLDAAAFEADHNVKLASKQRITMLLNRIDQALHKLEEGTYGYCEETGEPIGVDRLIARPIASLSLEAQERLEKGKKHGRMTVF